MKSDHHYRYCIEACLRCAAFCDHCAVACTKEKDIKMMTRCIELDMECAAICYTTARIMSLRGQFVQALCRVCADICEACAAECSKHDNSHCKECADACLTCAKACREM